MNIADVSDFRCRLRFLRLWYMRTVHLRKSTSPQRIQRNAVYALHKEVIKKNTSPLAMASEHEASSSSIPVATFFRKSLAISWSFNTFPIAKKVNIWNNCIYLSINPVLYEIWNHHSAIHTLHSNMQEDDNFQL